MNKLGFLLLAALASKGALASEVGAPFPQLANTTAVLAVAIAETGVSASLALEPNDEATSAPQHQELDAYTDAALKEMSRDFHARALDNMIRRVAVERIVAR